MSITTWAQVQLILGLAATQQTLVEGIIPHVEEDYLHIRNKPFDVGNILTITAPATADGNITVTVDGTDFLVAVLSGDNAMVVARKIKNSLSRFFDATTAGDSVTFVGYLTLAFDGAATGVTATASGINTVYPTGAGYTAIKMIHYHLTTGVASGSSAGVASESLGDYSISFQTPTGAGISDYPDDAVGGIRRYVSFT